MTTTTLQNPRLRQRGRASVNFLTEIARQSRPITQQVSEDITAAGITADALPDDLVERHRYIENALAGSDAYAMQNLLGDWHGKRHGDVCTEAFDEIEQDIADAVAAADEGPASLTLDPDATWPDYWEGVNFHRTTNGWTGHEMQGVIHGEIIHKRMVDKLYPGGIFKQRLAVAKMAPKENYERILEVGTSSGHYTMMLQEAYPDAQITGIDMSAQMLRHAYRVANVNGWNWDLHQMAGENTSFADNSFDLVTSFIILHEMPVDAIRALFAEALRVLAPGGDMVMSDVTRFADLDKLAAWKADRGAAYGGEPHWRSSAQLDFAALALKAGFAEAKAEGMYPHVVIASKAG